MSRKRRRMRRKRVGRWPLILLLVAVSILIAGSLLLLENKRDQRKKADMQEQADFGESGERETQKRTLSEFYFQQLSEEEQKIYKSLLNCVSSHCESIEVKGVEPETVGSVYQFLLNDHPELFWCSGTLQMTSYPLLGKIKVIPAYLYDSEESRRRQEAIQKEADLWLAGLPENGSEYDKLKYIYEQIVQRTEYQEGGKDDQNICSVLLDGKSVCAGYARTMQYLAERAGIFASYVTGTAKDPGSGKVQDHAWNLVKCDGAYSFVDPTWGDPVWSGEGERMEHIVYDYLCCPQEELFLTHTPDSGIVLPVCDAYDQEYYRKNGKFYESYDEEQIWEVFREDVEQQETKSVLKFGTAEAFLQAERRIQEVILPEVVQYLGTLYGLSEVQYSYQEEEQLRKITLYWRYE